MTFTFLSSNKERPDSIGEHGAALVEAAIIIPLMLVVLVGSFEFLRVSYNAMSIQFVAERVMRQYVVSPMNPTGLRNQVVATGRSVGLAINPADVTLCRLSTTTCSTIETTQPGDPVVLNIRVPTLAKVWGGAKFGMVAHLFQLTATVVGRNEP